MSINNKVEQDVSSIVGLSIVSGVLIFAGSFMPLIWMQGIMGGMMQGMMGVTFMNISWIGIISGSIIVFSAIMLNYYKNTKIWGALILAFAIISLFSFGGFIIGAILGIIAGGIAISRR